MAATETIVLEYQNRLQELNTSLSHATSKQSEALFITLGAVLLFLLLGWIAISKRTTPLWCAAIPLTVAVPFFQKYRQFRKTFFDFSRLKGMYEDGLSRMQGNWMGSRVNGEEYAQGGHLYEKDLNLLGNSSLFQLLCTTRTEIGRSGLASYLLHAAPLKEARARQEAVKELQPQITLREQLRLLGHYEFQESSQIKIKEWLAAPTLPVNRFIPVLLFCSSFAIGLLLLTGLVTSVHWVQLAPILVPLLAAQTIIAASFKEQVSLTLKAVRAIGLELAVLRQGLSLLKQQRFTSAKLTDLVNRVGEEDAPRSIRRLETLSNAIYQRNNDWFYWLSLCLALGTQLAFATERWKAKKGNNFLTWLETWAEFEALNALACYAHEHPEDAYPQFIDSEIKFEAIGMGHPLLSQTVCVRNDICLNQHSPFQLISGSNMSGKSTLMRAVGTNIVLAMMGAPVRAYSARLSCLNLCASLSLVDSLAEGKSRFMAEVDRLREILSTASRRPVLFLVDEIFSGTNSRDRRSAAEGVIRTLIKYGAIGLLSTHDLALTEIAELSELRGINVHMSSRNSSDPLDFDYRLKEGISKESNALAIARLAGVPV